MSVDSGERAPRLGFLGNLIVPPDFYPDRQIDTQTWAESLFEPLVLIGAVICFMLGIVQFGLAIDPGWPTQFLAPLGSIVGIEAFLYSRRLTFGKVQAKEWLVLLAPVVVATRFLPYLEDHSVSPVTDVESWLSQPLAIFSLGYVFDLILLLLVWVVIFGCTQLLNHLRVQPGEIVEASDRGSRYLQEDTVRAIDHIEPLRRLGQTFITGGIVLVIVSSLAALGTSQFLSIEAIGQILGFQRPSLHLVQLNVVLYFLLGLLLIGEAHFVRQRTLWRVDRLAMAPEITNRWVTGLAALVVTAIVIAFVLPTSYAMTLGDLITWVVFAVATIVGAIGAVLLYIFLAIAALFHPPGGKDNTPIQPIQPFVPHPPTTPGGPSPFDAIGSILFWIVALGIVIYSLSVLWRKRPAWLSQIRFGPILLIPWNLLVGLLRLSRKVGVDVARAVSTIIPRLFRAPTVNAPRSMSFISLSRMQPRQLVEYFYLSICERTAALGFPREPGVTPAEYERYLEARLPLVDPEIATVTAAFLEARYGPRPTTATQVKTVRGGWEILKKKLRAARLAK